jgi:transcriptional regulator with XRE-family HTH domain
MKELRDARGWSQTRLAKEVQKLGGRLSQQNVANIELGIVKNPKSLLWIAEVLGVLPQWLQTGKGYKTSAALAERAAKFMGQPIPPAERLAELQKVLDADAKTHGRRRKGLSEEDAAFAAAYNAVEITAVAGDRESIARAAKQLFELTLHHGESEVRILFRFGKTLPSQKRRAAVLKMLRDLGQTAQASAVNPDTIEWPPGWEKS